jgi:hypothetical protein
MVKKSRVRATVGKFSSKSAISALRTSPFIAASSFA